MKKFFFILITILLPVFHAIAGTCAGPTAITVNGACQTNNVNETSSYAAPTGCTGTIANDEWWTFSGTNGTTYNISYATTTNDNPCIAVYTGSCGSQTLVGCINATGGGNPVTETYSFTATSTTTYYIRVLNYGSGNMSGSLCLTSTVSAPSNDLCSGATSLPCATTNLAGTTVGTTNEADPIACGSNYGVWYTFVGDGQLTTISSNAAFDHEMVISSGSCGTLSNLTCQDAALSGGTETYSFTTVNGTTYFVYIAHYSVSSSTTGTFTISRTCTAAPTPPANDECSGAITLVSNTTCSNTAGTIYGATSSVDANGCFGTSDDDVWYSFVATAGSHTVTLSSVAGSVTDMYHSIYSGTCGSLTELTCSDANTSTTTGLTVGATYYIRVYTYTSTGGQNTTFNICVTGCNSTPANDNCSGATALTMNSFGSCASTSSGDVSCATASGTDPGSCFGNPDDDIWFSFIATSSSHSLTLTTSAGFDAYMQLYSGTCASLNSLQCSDPNTFNATGLTAGQTYYVRVYSYSAGSPTNGSLTLCVAEPPSCPANLGSGNVNIASLPYSATAQTTCGAGDDLTSANTVTCGSSSYLGDEDKVYIFTPTSSGQITVTLNATQSWGGATLYAGCPFSGSCVGFVQSSATGAKSFCTSVVSGTAYYLVIDGFGTTGNCLSSYSLSITAPTAGISNDLACSATSLTIGSALSGDNTCTSGTSEPSSAACWTTGSLNTVWYSFVATANTMNISTTLGTLTGGTQIALYSGTCSSLTYISCNEDPSSGCSGSTTANSVLDVSGLSIGTTYFIRVDGENDNTGTFTIVVNTGTSGSNSPVPGQDCSIPLVVCSSTMTIGNPGYANTGNICDFDGASDCTSGEKNSVWYQIDIAATGNFNFNLMPNDGTTSSCGAETDYDFLLWRMSGTGATTNCSGITANSSTALLACNFDGYGVTGIAAGGNAPAPINSCFNLAYEPTVSVTAGDVLYLCIQNFTGSTQGFTIDFSTSGVGVVNYTAPSTVYWTGGANTTWTNSTNWGSCSTVPSCAVNAVVTAASANQPIITGTENVKDLTINPGATLTLNAGAILNVCGNFTNNGTLVCSPTSTIIFNNAAVTQNIYGSLTGTNKFGNLTITKTGGSVILNDDLDIGGNFTTTNTTSIFDSGSKYVKVAGNFVNANGNSTFTNTGTTGTLEFNGTAAQTYTAGSSQLDLNYVVMNHTGTGVTLLSNMNVKSSTGTLTLTSGKIITNAFEVNVENTATSSVSTGNTTSYVQGNLRRSLLTTGSYDFPVGHATPGYQRANVNFTAATSIGNLLARFDTWPSTPPIQGGTDCGATFNQQAENNGYWTITANANPTTGTYNMTLYPLNATNTAGMSGWTIMKDPLISSNTWSLNGTCVVTSTATQVMRNGMNGFSVYGAAQSLTPLPIELINFTGKNLGKRNLLEWTTATEINNDYFTLERSSDGANFENVAIVDGAGNSLSTINYSKYDETPFYGITYYRLKQTDYNGDYSYSHVISLENGLNDVELSNVHPNPTSNDINFDFYSPIAGTIKVQVLDYTGRVVAEENMVISNGTTRLNAKMGELAKGIYSLKVTFDQTGYSSVNMIIKQ